MMKLKPHQCREKAIEILEVMKMWDIDYDSSWEILQIMRSIMTSTLPAAWKNPLTGTGMKVDNSQAVLPGFPNGRQ